MGDFDTPEQKAGEFNRDRPLGNVHDDRHAEKCKSWKT